MSAHTRALNERDLVVITAAAGWGKTCLLATAFAGDDTCWYRLDAHDRDPATLVDGLTHALRRASGAGTAAAVTTPEEGASLATIRDAWTDGPRRLVLEDAHELHGSPARELLVALSQELPADRQLIVSGRRSLELVDDRARMSDQVVELDARDLRLDLAVVANAVEDELDSDLALAARITDAVGGWPAGVRLALDALAEVPAPQRSAALDRLLGPSGPIGRYLRRVVATELDQATRELLACVQLLAGATTEWLTRITGSSPAKVDDEVESLLRRGLARHRADDPTTVELTPAIQRLVDDHLLAELEPDAGIVDAVVRALIDDGALAAGLAVLSRADRPEQMAALLERHGRELIHAGHLNAVASGVEQLPQQLRTPRIESLLAEALAFRGEWAQALRSLDAAGLEDEGPLSSELATQLGLIHHTRGDLAAAIAAYGRGPDQEDSAAFAVLLGWSATAHWLRGELDAARSCVEHAMELALRHGDDRALAYAHTAAALVAASDGDRRGNINHYHQALAAAEQVGDELQQARILTNLGSHHLEEGRYSEALEVTGRSIDLAERQGFATIIGVARCNRSEALLQTGAVDEAIADAERAREVFARIGARTEAYAHHVLAAARAERGELALARQAYERALRLGSPSGDRQALVPAHLGLAWVLAGTDPDGAVAAISRAKELDDGMAAPEVAAAEAWVALAEGDHVRAADLALTARQIGASRGNQAVVARATVCLALTQEDPLPGLRDGLALYRELGTPLWELRLRLAIACRSRQPSDRARAGDLERELTALSCPPDRRVWAIRALVGATDPNSMSIRALGGFTVLHAGRPVPASAWGSRKARELVKVLLSRAPRAVSREELGHLLWPDEPYDRISSRLSTALSLARTALAGEDGARDDAPIATDGSIVRLEVERTEVDVLTFRELAEAGLRATRTGDTESAVGLLLQAEELYGGDLFEDDPDLPWAQDRRVELRSLYLSVTRSLAKLVIEEEPELAIRLLLRVLDRDAYDEPAHLNLAVALLHAGRHGEARRRYHLYCDRMAELELPAVPFHEVMRALETDQRRRAAS